MLFRRPMVGISRGPRGKCLNGPVILHAAFINSAQVRRGFGMAQIGQAVMKIRGFQGRCSLCASGLVVMFLAKFPIQVYYRNVITITATIELIGASRLGSLARVFGGRRRYL